MEVSFSNKYIYGKYGTYGMTACTKRKALSIQFKIRIHSMFPRQIGKIGENDMKTKSTFISRPVPPLWAKKKEKYCNHVERVEREVLLFEVKVIEI